MIQVKRTEHPKAKPDFARLGFGKYFTDHMFVMRCQDGKSWQDPEVVPEGPLSLDPATMVFHYAQCIFEGLKAYKDEKGQISLFRPRDNFARLNRSCERMCIPKFDEELAMEGLMTLLKTDVDWIPTAPGTALYIRPTVIATDPFLGVKASRSYLFYIILSPVGAYYEHGLEPVRIYVEDTYVRAAVGGTGDIKCGANYAVSLKAGEIAKEQGFDQVLWLDAKTRKNVEEVGSMNIFFVFGDEVVTPNLTGSILPGITRDSVIKLCREEGRKVSERPVSVDELTAAAEEGRLTECFGSGTAAVISPVGGLHYAGRDFVIGGGRMGPVTQHLYDRLTGIQTRRLPDPLGWVTEVR